MSQRYIPEGSSYYQPRERSPPRRRDSEYDSFTPRDAPRGPKALNDAPRSSGPAGGATASRGRGPPSRGDFRPDPRDRQSSYTPSDRDRWPDRDLDRRERRPSPPPRGRTLPASDFRDARDPPRESDPPRARRDSRDGPSPSGSYFSDARGRGGFRGRGRGDWDARSRSRSSLPYADDRDHFRPPSPRPRSRSPPRRYERDGRDDRDTDRFRRDDERFDRDRDSDRYRRDPPHISTDTRRSSGGPSSTTPTTPHVSTFGSSQPQASAKSSTEHDRDLQRRPSTVTAPAPASAGARRDTVKSETARPSSPPQPTEVPAFGFTPASTSARQTSDGPWNVWKAPSDSKASQPASVATATVATKAPAVPPTTSKLDPEPPKAPKAERGADSVSDKKLPTKPTGMEQQKSDDTSAPRVPVGPAASQASKPTESNPNVVSPPTGPRQLAMPPSGPRSVTGSSTSSTTFQAPTGPRASSAFSPSTPLGINVPTGPKADRAPIGSALHRVSTAPSQPSSWQWNKSPPAQTFQPSPVTPAKRNSDGQERERPSFSARPTSSGASRPSITSGLSRNDERARSEESSMPLKLQSDNIMASPLHRGSEGSKRTGTHFAEEEDVMDLDDDDFESLEAKFEKEKALLLSKKADLRQFEFWDETITEDISRLTRILHVENLFKAQERESTRHPNSIATDTPDEDIPTPHTEEVQPIMIKVERSPTPEPTPPISTPEISALPFLPNIDLPMTPLSEKDTYQDILLRCDRLKEDVSVVVTDAKVSNDAEKQSELEEDFKTMYRPWKIYCQQLDKEGGKKTQDGREQEDQTTSEPAVEPVAPIVQGGTESRRRGMGFTSEFEFQQILKASEEIERNNQIKREREALLSKADYDKEAVIPDILLFSERSDCQFKDSSTLQEPADSVTLFELNPPRDDFTTEEHETLLKNFKEFPKKFGKLAQALPDRDYKDCIHHYYATKWNGQYKPPKDKRKRPLKRVPRTAKDAQGKPKASSTLISGLGVNVPDVYEGDESGKPIHSMTDRGRPKRAAAPTFGEKESEDPTSSAATPAKKGGKVDGDDLNGEKSAKKARTGKDSRQKKPKQTGAPSMRGRRAESMSPEKPENDGQLKPGPLANLTNKPREFPEGGFPPGASAAHHLAMQAQVDAPQTLPAGVSNQSQQQPKTGPSSYWSVQDVSSFPLLLEHFGTDWQKIATQMGTKSSTMVKNYFQRHVNGGKTEFQNLAEKGDSRKDKGDVPPPPIPPTAPTQARKRVEQPPHAAPRPLAPNLAEGADNDEGGTPPPHARAIPQYQGQPAAQYPGSQPISERPAVSHVTGEHRSGLFASTQPPMLLKQESRSAFPGDSYRGNLSHLQPGSTQAPTTSGYPPRDREAYERGAASASRSREQGWAEHVPDAARSQYPNAPGSRLPVSEYERHRMTSAQSPPVSYSTIPATSERLDSRSHHFDAAQQGKSRVESLLAGAPPRAGYYDSARSTQPMQERIDPRDPPPPGPTTQRYDFDRPPPPRPAAQQAPKVSSLMSLLNDDPPSQPPASRTQTPPHQGYPPLAPPSRSSSTFQERRDPPGDPSRASQAGYPPPAYAPSSQPPPQPVDWLLAASSSTRERYGREYSSGSPRFTEHSRLPPRETAQQSPRMMPMGHSGSRTDFTSRSGFSAVPGPHRTATPPQGGHHSDRFHGDRPQWESAGGMPPLGVGYDRRPMPATTSRGSPHNQSLGLSLAHSQAGRSSVPPAPLHRQDSNPSSFGRPGYRSSLADVLSPRHGPSPPPPTGQHSSIPPYYERERIEREQRERERHGGYPPPAPR